MKISFSLAGFWQYLRECVQILYWAFFKPYTFERWLKEIDPELELLTNPWEMKSKFNNNTQLKKYAQQTWWLIAVAPSIITLITGILYSKYSAETFNWIFSALFFLGWLIGLIWSRTGSEKTRLQAFILILKVGLGSFLINVGLTFLPNIFEPVREITFGSTLSVVLFIVGFGVAFGMVFGVTVGLAISLAGGLAIGVAFGVGFGVAGGVAVGVVLGVARSVTVGLAGGVVEGVAFGVTVGVVGGVVFGMGVGVAVGVSLIAGALRLYFWIIELPWAICLFVVGMLIPSSRCIQFIPQRFDELIILPLPFIDNIIIDAHRDNPIAAQNTIDYLITSTNQQTTAARAIAGITAETLQQCQTAGDIAATQENLAWLPANPPKQFGKILGQILPELQDISQDVKFALDSESPYRQAELLNTPIRKLEQLNKSLVNQSTRFATTFGAITHRWLRILTDAQTSL